MKNLQKLLETKLKELNCHIKDVKETEDNKFKVIASSEDIDRDWEIIQVDWWKSDNWFKNPVILSNHTYEVENIVWKWFKLYKEWKNLILEGVFTDITESWKICKELYKKWFLKSVSVWFRGKRDEENKNIFKEAELLEVSFVAVPCNPNALSLDWKTYKKGLKMGLIKEMEKETEEKTVSFKEFIELKKEVSGIQETLKIIADGKALTKWNESEDSNSEKIIKEFFQNLSKNVSNSLCQLKKNESK